MAFPSDQTIDLQTAWTGVRREAGVVKGRAAQMSAASSVTRLQALEFANQLADSLSLLDTLAATPGLAAYAQEQVNNAQLNIASEFSAMRTQIVATQDWLVANFPKAADGALAVYAFDPSKRFANVNLTAGQVSAFKAQLNALIATIA